MKTIKCYLCFALFALFTCSGSVYAASEYEKVMGGVLDKLDSAKTIDDLLQCRSQFERISAMYPENWLPVYYVAYSDIQIVFYPGEADKQQLLDDAKTKLEQLADNAGADLSEVNTLWGYYYNALVMLDPQNGQKYYQMVLEYYEKAIRQNPENPRPVCLMAFYKQYLPPFLKSEKEIAEGKAKAKELFDKEERTIQKPYWGANFLEWIKTEDK